jgi:hypothetical protein
MDTEELFKRNLETQRHQLEKHGWLNKKIKYQFDNFGFRKKIKNNFGKNILFLGCSFTFGVGINYEDSFTNIVADALEMNNVNWSIPGSSNDTAFRLCKQYLDKQTPSMVIVLSPIPYRLELFSDLNGESQSHNVTSLQRQGDPPFLNDFKCPIEMFDKTFALLNREKNILAMEMLCLKNKIKFLHLNVEQMTVKDLGRDLAHPGVRSNQVFAETILRNKI